MPQFLSFSRTRYQQLLVPLLQKELNLKINKLSYTYLVFATDYVKGPVSYCECECISL